MTAAEKFERANELLDEADLLLAEHARWAAKTSYIETRPWLLLVLPWRFFTAAYYLHRGRGPLKQAQKLLAESRRLMNATYVAAW